MPFDTAARPLSDTLQFAEATPAGLASAFAQAGELDAGWAAANPERALAFLMVSPTPGPALDVLLSL